MDINSNLGNFCASPPQKNHLPQPTFLLAKKSAVIFQPATGPTFRWQTICGRRGGSRRKEALATWIFLDPQKLPVLDDAFCWFLLFQVWWWDGYVMGNTCNQKVQGQGSSKNCRALVVEPSTFELSAMTSVLRFFFGPVLIENIQQEMTEVA